MALNRIIAFLLDYEIYFGEDRGAWNDNDKMLDAAYIFYITCCEWNIYYNKIHSYYLSLAVDYLNKKLFILLNSGDKQYE